MVQIDIAVATPLSVEIKERPVGPIREELLLRAPNHDFLDFLLVLEEVIVNDA